MMLKTPGRPLTFPAAWHNFVVQTLDAVNAGSDLRNAMAPLRAEVICKVRRPFLQHVGECVYDRRDRTPASDERELSVVGEH
jgi:hypothetical protein